MGKLTEDINRLMDELGFEEDPRLKSMTQEEFDKSIEEMDKKLEREFEEIENRREQARINFHLSGDAYVYDK